VSSVSRFRPLHEPDGDTVRFTWEGETIRAATGISLAAALLQAGAVAFRESPVSGAPRAPFCMMGSCFECLVEVDGQRGVQACMTEISEGMHVRRLRGIEGGDDGNH
jgi:predicted molibdopterin-dependent oxidoreductase YjgC